MTPRPGAEKKPLTVDARGMRCPWPVLRAARAMRDSDHVVLLADDPIALKDVPDMANARGWSCSLSQDKVSTIFTLKKQGDGSAVKPIFT